MNWFIYSLLATLVYSIAAIIVKYIADKKSEPIYLSIIGASYSALTGVAIVLLQRQIVFHLTPIIVGAIILSAGLGAIGIITYYAAIKYSDISEFVLFTRTQVLFIFLGGILFFRETFTIWQGIGIACIFLGAIVISISKTKIRLHKGSILALITAVLFAASTLIDRSIISNFSASLYTSIIYFVIAIVLIIPTILAWKKRRKIPPTKTWIALFFTSSLFAISTLFVYSSYKSGGYVSLTTLIGQLQIPIIVLYGLFVFHEKDRLAQKIIAMILMVAGAYILHT